MSSVVKSIIHQENCEFNQDVLAGLSQKQKSIPSKYFYDRKGSDLFNQITRHPDYYLTGCEFEILQHYKDKLADLFGDQAFNLIELGPGEAVKTRILIEDFVARQLSFTYVPIDISKKYLQHIVEMFEHDLPNVNTHGINSDYFKGLEWVSRNSLSQNLVLFLGSSIGNFNLADAQGFLRHLWSTLHDGDYVFIGFDLKKQIDVLMQAYNDTAGITREFNLNLLRRMNHELGANFNVGQFFHYPNYNVTRGAMESYIVSKMDQEVYIAELNKTFVFESFEPIHVEYSFKYNLQQLNRLAQQTGFAVVEQFFDDRKYFVDVLWQVKK